MLCPDSLTCFGNALSLLGTAVAALQVYKASDLLRRADRLAAEDTAQTDSRATSDNQSDSQSIPIEDAYNIVANKLRDLATGWRMKNHRWLVFGIIMALLGQAISLYRAAVPL